MLPRNTLKNVHALMANLVLFKLFSAKFSLNFFYPNSECFAQYDAFCSHIFDYACLRHRLRLIAIEEVRKYGKNCIHQKHFPKWRVGGCILLILTPWIRSWP